MKYLMFFVCMCALLSFVTGCCKKKDVTSPEPETPANAVDDDSAGDDDSASSDATPAKEELSDEEKARRAAEAINATGGVKDD